STFATSIDQKPRKESPFRSCLQGNSKNNELDLCFETKASSFTHSLFINSSSDPFATITDAMTAVKFRLRSFHQRFEKKLHKIVDYFGWCTWDAFYQNVTQEGVEDGLKSLSSAGVLPKFVIIDDGWQSVGLDAEENKKGNKSELLLRLTGVEENDEFKKENPTMGIKSIVDVAKGGVQPGLEEYESSMKFPTVSKGVLMNEPNWKMDPLAVQGLGLCVLETLGENLGGRVQLTRQFHQALDASVAKNFPDNGIIACMSHNTDSVYCSKQTAIVRASDDFYPRDPVSHTIHLASVSYNSIFLGEFMQPDWDMFHSLHPVAEYHSSARAITVGLFMSGNNSFQLSKLCQ
ncbi:hypothetical protein IFM89_006060, partial [Coptis chinensis]